MHTAPRQVHVRVPATTANLGSGFDILGLALQLYNVFTMTMTSDPGWHVSLPRGARLPRDDRNLVFRAARALFTRVGVTPPGLHLSLSMHIPLARGLGSSSSAIVGGLMAANLLAAAMDDRLHQPYRAALIPGMTAAIAAGYTAGACGVALSGAGPTLLAIAETAPDAVAHALRKAFAQHGVTCRTRLLHADT